MAWQNLTLKGFSPDLPPNHLDVIRDSQLLLPTVNGYTTGIKYAGGSLVTQALSLGAAKLMKSDGTVRRFVGTANKIYEDTTDRSLAAYGVTKAWQFAQFGSISLAINKDYALQSIAGGAAFAAVGGAPKAGVMTVCGGPSSPFVMLLNYNDGTDVPDGWFCSAVSDYTGWTTGTNECAKGQLLTPSGPLTCGIKYRDGILAFKNQGIFMGEYVGAAPVIWQWTRICSDIGALGKYSAVEVDDVVYFASWNGLWMFDGSYPKKMPGAVHQWWSALGWTANAAKNDFVHAVWHPTLRVIIFTVPDANYNTSDYLAYNVDSQQWTRGGVIPSDSRLVTDTFRELYSYDYGTTTPGTTQGNQATVWQGTTKDATSKGSFSTGFLGDGVNVVTISGVRPNMLDGNDLQVTGNSAAYMRKTPPSLTSVSFNHNGTTSNQYDGMISGLYVGLTITLAISAVTPDNPEIGYENFMVDIVNSGKTG